VGGKDTQRFCLFVSGESPVTELSQLKGKRLGYLGSEDLAALKYCFFRNVPGYSADRYFKEVKQMNNARVSLLSLRLRETDVIAGFEYLAIIENKVDPFLRRRIKVIVSSVSIPNLPVFASTTLTKEKQEKLSKIKKYLLKYHQNPEGEGLLRYFKINRFVPFQEEKYKYYFRWNPKGWVEIPVFRLLFITRPSLVTISTSG
jgi:ABC-type phosphate/phosphonate transport system substrate-binding protein